MPTPISEQLAAQVGAQFGIPPAILYALALHETNFDPAGTTGVGMFNLPEAVVVSMGYSPADVKASPELQTSLTAKYLSEQFAQQGDWTQVLSGYVGGSPGDASSPSSPVGGEVNAILGIAASRSSFGMLPVGSFKPAHAGAFLASAANFTKHAHQMVSLGGVITQDSINQFLQCTQYVWQTTPWVQQMGSFPNAADWGDKARKAGLNEGQTPKEGAVVWWGAGQGGAGDAGHVARVEKVNPDGTFTVTESNWPEGSTPVHGRVVSPQDVGGFIYAPPGKASEIIQQGQATASQSKFAADVLQKAGLPDTPRNRAVLGAMAQGEGMPTSTNNPLASTQGQGTAYNSTGVKNYATYTDGVAATAETILNGNFPGLVDGLKGDQAPAYYTSGPGAEALGKWQGGGTSDLGLLAGMADPGAKPAAPVDPAAGQKPIDKVTPAQVADFAQRAQALGISPQMIHDSYSYLASLYNRFLNKTPTLQDLAHFQGMTPQEMLQSVRDMPSPYYPEVTAGALLDSFNHATLHSLPNQKRFPTLAEANQFVAGKLNPNQVAQYYQRPTVSQGVGANESQHQVGAQNQANPQVGQNEDQHAQSAQQQPDQAIGGNRARGNF